MLDRIVEFPNRIKLVPVAGQPNVYDVEAQPGTVTEEGTPLNKVNLLSDNTGSIYGLDKTGTVDDAFFMNVNTITVTIPSSGWSTARDSNDYVYQRINVAGINSKMQPLASLKSPQDKNQQGYWLYVKFIETYDGYIICRAANKVPIDLVVELKGV